jgi:hypothetical protein
VTPGWTITEASAEFARTGRPIEPWRLRLIIRALRLRPVGAMPSGDRGGRGQALYPISELQRLHAALTPWLLAPDSAVSRETSPDRPDAM